MTDFIRELYRGNLKSQSEGEISDELAELVTHAGDLEEHPHDGDDFRHVRLMAAVPPQEGPPDDVQADEDDSNQQVDQDHRTERVQERTVGIQKRREQLRRLPEPSAIKENTADEERLDDARRDGIRNLGLHRQEQERAGQEQDDGQPEMVHIMALRFGDVLRRHLEQGGSVDDHGYADAARQRPYREAVRQTEARVHPVERAGFQFIDHLEAHDDRNRPGLLHPCQEPFRAVIDIGQCR